MDIKNFVLSYYKNSDEQFHIHKVEHSFEAQKPHTHAYFQIYYILKGELIHFLENESSTLVQGDMFIIPPETTHYISPRPETVFYSFSFMPDFLGAPHGGNRLTLNFLRSLGKDKSLRPKVTVEAENILYIETLMNRMLSEFSAKPLGYAETMQAYALLLVTFLARNYFEKEQGNFLDHFENNKQFVLHCIRYVEENYAEPISLDEISRRSAMSKSNFCILFSQLTGHSFHQYLNLCRIKKAVEYINDGYKITAIYGLCGYEDFSTFYRNFKKIMGVSPKQFQKNSR